jgi:glycerophosphoryl diester phosphodiesterase
MKVLGGIEFHTRRLLDRFFAYWPQSHPGKNRLRHCKIISHRGEHDNRRVFENTLSAFDKARKGGVWGIEFDIRWTKDLHPVVLHDSDLRRVFGSTLIIHQATLAELKSECALIPSLEQVIERYGKHLHLMVEIKDEVYPDPVRQHKILKELFSALEPENDYHFLSLAPEMFKRIEFAPRSTFLPVARLNFYQLSKLALEHKYQGIAGHYVLLTAARLKKHHAFQQKVGTGYINSKNCLFRELNRGVEWIFSDNAVALQKIVNRLLSKSLNGKE